MTGVPAEILNPKKSWKPGGVGLKQEATKLATLFMENFKKYENEAAPDIVNAGK